MRARFAVLPLRDIGAESPSELFTDGFTEAAFARDAGEFGLGIATALPAQDM